MKTVIIVMLVALSAGCLSYVTAYAYVIAATEAERRRAALKNSRQSRQDPVDPMKRRKALADSLKEIEAENKGKKASLSQQIGQAGLSWSVPGFWIRVGVFAAIMGIGVYLLNGGALVAVGVVIVSALGLPRWFLSFLRKRRIKKFLAGFPEAIDVIIRGIKAGLPVGDCFRLIANEGVEPLRSEFRRVVEVQSLGLSIGDAVERLAERIQIPETSFFSIVVNVQEKAGGNLSEALGNLAAVLRDRKRMKEKVSAISAEAKASAGIIGSLPFLVGGVVYFVNPSYMMLLFTTTAGNMILAGSFIWMAVGVFIMRGMINFEI